MTRLRAALSIALFALAPALPRVAFGCFGARLRVGVSAESAQALASYAAGYYVEEKTGVAPEFVDVKGDPGSALRQGEVDVFLAGSEATAPGEVSLREAGEIPGLGPGRFWIRPEVLDDLRFFTVERALKSIPGFYGSEAYREVSESGAPPKAAARRAVLRAP